MKMKNNSALWTVLALALVGGLAACGDDEPTAPTTIAAPSNVQVTRTANGVEVSWSAVSGADSYTVERDIVGDAAGYGAIATGVTTTSHEDTNITPGLTYQYRVRAVAGSQTSVPSNEAEFVFGAVLGGPPIGNGQVRQLSADTVYILEGIVAVDSGGELRIPAGTEIFGSVQVQPTALIVRQGGKIFADGTAAEPIVFTSARPVGQRARGDWGGVVLNGYSNCNFPADQCVGEGNSGPYGGSLPNDNSGRLAYVRVEYAGFEVSFGNELNALTLNGVGSGTELHHIQAHYGSDDGIEFFGGTVDLKYAIVTGASDDSFDYSTGWQGRGQFWIAQQDPNDADNGFEVDNNEADFSATPLTNPTMYNVTVVGKAPGTGSSGESTRGLLLRRGTAGKIYNLVVLGFEVGLDIDNTETYNQCTAGELLIENAIFFDYGAFLDADSDDETTCTSSWTTIRQEAPGLTDPYNRTAPDFRPAAGSNALSGFSTPPDDGFFTTPADYLGGVDPSGTPWYEGWITTAQN